MLRASSSLDSRQPIIVEDNPSLRKSTSVTGPPPVPQKPADINSLTAKSRQDVLEVRHQELLQRQRQLQEQYQRLQDLQQKKSAATIAANNPLPATIHSNNLLLQQQQLQQQQLLMMNESSATEESHPDLIAEEASANDMPASEISQDPDEVNVANEKQLTTDAIVNDASDITINDTGDAAKQPEAEKSDVSKNCLSEDYPFADSSLRDGETSSESTSKAESPKTDEEAETHSGPKSEPPPLPISAAPVKSSNGKIPPVVPARKSKEGNGNNNSSSNSSSNSNNNTKVYHSEII